MYEQLRCEVHFSALHLLQPVIMQVGNRGYKIDKDIGGAPHLEVTWNNACAWFSLRLWLLKSQDACLVFAQTCVVFNRATYSITSPLLFVGHSLWGDNLTICTIP
jgi:hypothetical protein